MRETGPSISEEAIFIDREARLLLLLGFELIEKGIFFSISASGKIEIVDGWNIYVLIEKFYLQAHST